MPEQDTSSDPQNNSASGTSSSSGAPSNQPNSNPVTESEKPNNPTTETSNKEEEKTEEKRNRFKEWLYKYNPEDNPILDSDELNNKYPIDILKSIFKPATRDIQILIVSLILATVHLFLYNLNIPIVLEIIRILLMLALILYLARTSHVAYQNSRLIINSFKSNPLQFFTFIIACGGTFALVVPSTMNIFKLIGDSTALTTAMLGITGGIIAVFGLIKSHQKSELEREQLELQKSKDSNDHIRQIKIDRHSRYIKANGQLADDKSIIRLGGIYSLFGLWDEWTSDTDSYPAEQRKECQAIINNLCAYIRSPFPLAEEIYKFMGLSLASNFISNEDRIKFSNEKEIRQIIFQEMSSRIINEKNIPDDEIFKYLKFNFEGAPIFYKLKRLKFINANFSNAVFYEADMTYSKFYATQETKTKFCGAIFHQKAELDNATFWGATTFSKSNFKQGEDFNNCYIQVTDPSHEYLFWQESNLKLGFSYMKTDQGYVTYRLPLGAVPFYGSNAYEMYNFGSAAMTDSQLKQAITDQNIIQILQAKGIF